METLSLFLPMYSYDKKHEKLPIKDSHADNPNRQIQKDNNKNTDITENTDTAKHNNNKYKESDAMLQGCQYKDDIDNLEVTYLLMIVPM